MKIAVVGGGIFGCVSALKLLEAGHKVTLFEREKSLLSCASGINQYRLHRGYHYPRSKETVQYVKESSILFEEEFPSSICAKGFDRYYGISNEESLINSSQYLTFLEDNKLEYEIIEDLSILKMGKVELIVKVIENGFDLSELYLSIVSKLSRSKVRLRTNTTFTQYDSKKFDVVINATYANINSLLSEDQQVDYQFELCEKPIVQLPKPFKSKSVVILDGDFCCFDPVGFNPNYQVLGHVKHAIHERHIGKFYNAPNDYLPILNKGAVFTPLSKFENIQTGFQEYFNVDEITYKGSMFTVRTVLPQHEFDDARPSNIIKHSDNLYSIFSGKIGTCVDIANKLTKMI